MQLTTLIVYADLWLVSVDAPVRQEVFGTSPQTNHLKRSDILKFAHQAYSVNSSKKWQDSAGAFSSFRVLKQGYPLSRVWCQKWRPSLASCSMSFKMHSNCQWVSNQNQQAGFVSLWKHMNTTSTMTIMTHHRIPTQPFPGAIQLLRSFDRAQAAPFERQPLKMARTSPIYLNHDRGCYTWGPMCWLWTRKTMKNHHLCTMKYELWEWPMFSSLGMSWTSQLADDQTNFSDLGRSWRGDVYKMSWVTLWAGHLGSQGQWKLDALGLQQQVSNPFYQKWVCQIQDALVPSTVYLHQPLAQIHLEDSKNSKYSTLQL